MYTRVETSTLAEPFPVAKPSYLGGFGSLRGGSGGFDGGYGGCGDYYRVKRSLKLIQVMYVVSEASVEVMEALEVSGDGIAASEVDMEASGASIVERGALSLKIIQVI